MVVRKVGKCLGNVFMGDCSKISFFRRAPRKKFLHGASHGQSDLEVWTWSCAQNWRKPPHACPHWWYSPSLLFIQKKVKQCRIIRWTHFVNKCDSQIRAEKVNVKIFCLFLLNPCYRKKVQGVGLSSVILNLSGCSTSKDLNGPYNTS